MINRVTPRSSIVLAVLLILLVACGIAGAQVKTDGGDPFARLDAELNDAASRTLDRLVQPDLSGTIGKIPPKAEELAPVPPQPAAQGALQRVERLRPVIEPILRQVGVPLDLTAVVLVESGGNPAALSPKGARGLWQFMPETARRYGLTVSADQDDRLDVQKSTRAAARYLRDLYRRFGDWPLALAAYNAGEEAVSGAMGKASRSDFIGISDSLPRETQNYVPAVLAAMGHSLNAKPTQLLARRAARVLYATADLD